MNAIKRKTRLVNIEKNNLEKRQKKTRSKTYSNNEIYTESRARTDFTTSAGTQVAWMDKQGGRSTIKDNS